MRELFRKYLDNNCSPAEIRKLLAYFNIDVNEVILRRLITEWLEENEEEEEKNKWQDNFFRVLGFIKKQMNIQMIKLTGIFSLSNKPELCISQKSNSLKSVNTF